MVNTRHAPIILLIADGFDERAAITLTVTLREAGLQVILVGLRVGPSRGIYGLAVMPDKTLEQILTNPGPFSAALFPGQAAYITRLRNDPRVGVLLGHCIESGAMLVGLGLTPDQLPSFFIDGNRPDLWLIPDPNHTLEQIVAALTRRLEDKQGG